MQRHQVPAADIALDSVSVLKNDCVIQQFRELEIEQLGTTDALLQDIERLLRRAGARDHDGRPKLFRVRSLPAPTPDAPSAQVVPVG